VNSASLYGSPLVIGGYRKLPKSKGVSNAERPTKKKLQKTGTGLLIEALKE
jgi:hypothetical protein